MVRMTVIFSIYFCSSLLCMQEGSVRFLCKYSKEFRIPLQKLPHFLLLENLFEEGLEQPIDLSPEVQNCFARILTGLLKIIPDLPTQNIKKDLLPKDFKSNLELALLGNAVGFNKDYFQEIVHHFCKKPITQKTYGGIKKLVLAHNNGRSSKPLLLQCVTPQYTCVQTLNEHKEPINGLELNQENYLISAGDTTIKVWNPQERYQCIQTLTGTMQTGYPLIFNPHHKHFLSTASNTIQIWKAVPSIEGVKKLDAIQLLALIAYMHNEKTITKEHERDFGQLPQELQEELKNLGNT